MKSLEQLRIDAWEKKHGKKVHKYFTQEFDVKKPSKASELENLIDEYCCLMGAECTRIFSGGRHLFKQTNVKDVMGRSNTITDSTYIKGTTRAGTSDLIIMYRSCGFYAELKLKDRQSKTQKEWQKRVEGFGNIYKIFHSLDEFIEYFIQFKEGIDMMLDG